jgi:hypothetical protein
MAVKLFIVGLPGSGKSAIARYINAYIQRKNRFNPGHRWLTSRYNDYPILYTMYKDDNEHKRFLPAEPSGFNVIDFNAFDEALKSLGQWIVWLILSKKIQPEEIVLIEFARNDYQIAFRQFDKDFLQNAYFIYLGANLENCKQRISDRTANPEFEDDYPVCNDIFETYYHSDNGQLLSQILAQEFGIDRRQVLLLENNGSLEEAKEKIAPFVDSIIDPETTEDEAEDTSADNSTIATPESSLSTPKVPTENKDYQLAGYLTR